MSGLLVGQTVAMLPKCRLRLLCGGCVMTIGGGKFL